MKNDCKERRFEKVSQQKRKKTYIKPRLIEFGHIEKLTQGATGRVPDGAGTKTWH